MPQNQIIGTENNDFLSDTILDDDILALEGDDQIELSSGNDWVDGGAGNDELTINYSESNEDLMFNLQGYQNYTGYDYPSIDGSINVHSHTTAYNSFINFYNIESFKFISGSGNDQIDLGDENFSDDLIDAGAGNDFIFAGLGNDAIDGGSGFDVLRLDFSLLTPETRVISQLTDSNSGEYHYGLNTIKFSNIEAIDLISSYQDDILVALTGDSNLNEPMPYPMNSIIDGGEGKDQLVADYSHQSEDLMFNLQGHQNYTGYDYPSIDGSIEVHSYMTGYNSRIDFYNIESFKFISGSGNDQIDLGYENFSDDLIDAGGGNDFISAGLGNDTIDGGSGFDVLRLDFSLLTPHARVISQLTDSNSGEYHYGLNTIKFSNIEAIDLIGSYQDDILVALTGDSNPDEPIPYPMNSIIDGGEGKDQLVADYSHQSEDLRFYQYTDNSISVNSYISDGYENRFEFNNIESFFVQSGSGNDFIEIGSNLYDYEIHAGAGNDSILISFDNGTINGGTGSDTYHYIQRASDILISDDSGDNDIIVFNSDITLDDISLSFEGNNLIFDAVDSSEGKLVIENYASSPDSIESIDVEGQIFSVEEIIALRNNPITVIDTGDSNNVIADYSDHSEDLQFWLNSVNLNPVLEINSYMTGYIAHIDLDNDSSLEIHSGSGNDHIDLGYDNVSDDVIDAGAGNDFIFAGLGDDNIDGGSGF
ncbi:MAG: hypothetical protein AAF652_10955, partial [Cyanobacteria bacterium P01_C01_bin.72]